MIELIDKEDALDACRAEVWEGEALADINSTKPILTIPENPTNGDMIKAIFPNVEVKEKNNGYEVYFGIGTAIQFFNHQWWNAPYNAKSEVKADDGDSN